MQLATAGHSRFREMLVFLALCIFVWPIVAVAAIGTYGLGWWIYLSVAGPTGPA
jgi:nitrate reductase NapE component